MYLSGGEGRADCDRRQDIVCVQLPVGGRSQRGHPDIVRIVAMPAPIRAPPRARAAYRCATNIPSQAVPIAASNESAVKPVPQLIGKPGL